jgi:N-acetylglucosaminyl-diphospho-decaprenol L-rhamnosyltransferase
MTAEAPHPSSRPAPPVDVHVSIVTHRNRELLRRCLDSLPSACGGGITWRVTVVDNTPGDGTQGMITAQFPHVELIENRAPLGFGANHNKALRETVEAETARYVLVLNDDTELEPDSVERLVAFCDARPEVGAAGPLILGADMSPQSSLYPFPSLRNELRTALCVDSKTPRMDTGDWLNGCCILIRTATAREIGLWDERFFLFYEDADLCIRLVRAGWSVALCEQARVVHLGHASISVPQLETTMSRQMLRSRYLYFRKHHGRAKAFLVVQEVRVALLARSVKALLVGLLARDTAERTHGAALLKLALYRPGGHPRSNGDSAVRTS